MERATAHFCDLIGMLKWPFQRLSDLQVSRSVGERKKKHLTTGFLGFVWGALRREPILVRTLLGFHAPPTKKDWVVVSNIFYFHPEPWGTDPIWLIFLKWVETTSQKRFVCFFFCHKRKVLSLVFDENMRTGSHSKQIFQEQKTWWQCSWGGNQSCFWMTSQIFLLFFLPIVFLTHIIHVWYIYLHVLFKLARCWYIYQSNFLMKRWIPIKPWDCFSIKLVSP